MRAGWWWIDRWRKSTAYTDMTAEQQGVYRNLLDELWLRDGLLPLSEKALAQISGDSEAWPRCRAVVLARFEKTDAGYRNGTHDEVAAQSRSFRDAQADAGRARAASAKRDRTGRLQPASPAGKSSQSQPDVQPDVQPKHQPTDQPPTPTPTPTPNQTPTQTPGREEARKRADPDPLEVLAEFGALDRPEVQRALEDYLRGRRERRQKPQTPRGLRMGLRKLEPFGVAGAVQAIEEATQGGWLGFFEPKPGGRTGSTPRGMDAVRALIAKGA